MTITDIANVALEEIGAKAIGNIDGDDVFARKIKRRLPLTIAEVSAKRDWSCLVQEIELSRIEEKASDGSSKFNLPRNVLKILSPRECRIEGDFVLFREDNLTVKCTLYEDNPDKWNIYLQLAIIAQLKADICFTVTGDAQLALNLKNLARTDIERYMKNDIIQSRKSLHSPPIIAEGYFV